MLSCRAFFINIFTFIYFSKVLGYLFYYSYMYKMFYDVAFLTRFELLCHSLSHFFANEQNRDRSKEKPHHFKKWCLP